MSDYSLLFDVAKVRHADLIRDAEIARKNQNLRRNLKSTSFTKKLRVYFLSKS